ncbi:MAG: DUF2791 family P-loop domain-containing protein [Chloroflexi bacterium]|nr:DUF2791 family P-loop domain-containing protein [Chloroflexota bacterium]
MGWEFGIGVRAGIDKVTVKELAVQRYRFIPRLMVAAGYAGWVILLDEIELMGRYSLRQRAKSYAEMAWLMGKLQGDIVPGLAVAMSITEDYAKKVLEDRNDEERIYGWEPPRHTAANRTLVVRQHIKSWINEWDLQRLYPDYEPATEVTDLRPDYSEMPELEEPADSPSDGEDRV